MRQQDTYAAINQVIEGLIASFTQSEPYDYLLPNLDELLKSASCKEAQKEAFVQGQWWKKPKDGERGD